MDAKEVQEVASPDINVYRWLVTVVMCFIFFVRDLLDLRGSRPRPRPRAYLLTVCLSRVHCRCDT
jgi:hypothetical protein